MKCILICFLGIDGSGKSTLSKYLYEELKKRNYNVLYTWWMEGENSLLRRLLRRIGRQKLSNLTSKKTKAFKKSIALKIFRALFPNIVLLDYLRFGIVKAWFPKILSRGKKVMIFDRFIYDVILGLSREFEFSDSKKERLLKIFSRLIPSPDIIFIVDVPPEISYLRKKGEIKSLEDAKAIYDEYQDFLPILSRLTKGKIVRIDNSGEIDLAKAKVLEITLKFLDGDVNGG